MVGLYSDPVGQAIITDVDNGNEWKFEPKNNPYVNGGTISFKRGRVTTFELNFDAPYEKGLEFLSASGPFKVGNKVDFRIGWAASGRWTPWAKGFLKSGGDALSLDADGLSGGISVQGCPESRVYVVSKDMLKKAGWDPIKILEGCADGMGLIPQISVGASQALNSYKLIGEARGGAVRKKAFAFSCGLLNFSYWEVVKKVCDEYNLVYWMGNGVGVADDFGRNLFISTRAEASRGVEQDSVWRSYIIRGPFDPNNDSYPCFNWSPEGGTAAWLASSSDPAAHGVKRKGISTETGEDVDVEVKPEEQPEAIVGSLADGEPSDVVVDGVKEDESRGGEKPYYFSGPVADGSGGTEKFNVETESRQAKGNAAQKGNITTIGVPDERCGNLCYLGGAGEIYNGTYEVDMLTHVFAPGSWQMTLTVHRKGRVAVSGDQKETSDGQMPSRPGV